LDVTFGSSFLYGFPSVAFNDLVESAQEFGELGSHVILDFLIVNQFSYIDAQSEKVGSVLAIESGKKVIPFLDLFQLSDEFLFLLGVLNPGFSRLFLDISLFRGGLDD
jgi:hypothetical protein